MQSELGTLQITPCSWKLQRGTVMHVNHLPPPVEVLGGNIPVILDGTGCADISKVVRPQISKPTLTHDYFTWS